jgi:hypothetical protein
MSSYSPSRRQSLVAIILITLAILSCNAPERSVAPPGAPSGTPTSPPTSATLSPTPPQGGDVTLTPGGPVATPTPAPDVPGQGGCTLNAAYVADITIADDSEFQPGASFTKIWRIRNSGTCTWEEGAQLVAISGDRMSDVDAVNAPQTAPETSVDISVDMKAPTTPGTYRSTWQMQDPQGVRFGAQIYVQIVVPSPATNTPTSTATPTATLTATPTVTPTEAPAGDLPDLLITSLKVDAADPRQGVPLYIIAEIENQGDGAARNFRWAWRVCVTEGCDYTEAPGALTLEPGEKAIAQMAYTFKGWSNYTTEAWADSREEVRESNEDNNTRQLTIAVQQGLPDLIISNIAFDPDPPVQGESANVEVTVKNQGSKPAGAFKVTWWASVNAPAYACDWAVSALAENEQVKLTCAHTYASWYANITTRAVADSESAVGELDEANNSLEKQTTVEKP